MACTRHKIRLLRLSILLSALRWVSDKLCGLVIKVSGRVAWLGTTGPGYELTWVQLDSKPSSRHYKRSKNQHRPWPGVCIKTQPSITVSTTRRRTTTPWSWGSLFHDLGSVISWSDITFLWYGTRQCMNSIGSCHKYALILLLNIISIKYALKHWLKYIACIMQLQYFEACQAVEYVWIWAES